MTERDIARRGRSPASTSPTSTQAATPTAITELCRRAVTPHGPVAAVCIWPAFVAQAKRELANTPVRVATVVNFPAGDDPLEETRAETREALSDGADEIDFVVPWRRLAEGHPEAVAASVREIKDICGPAVLKAILETGELGEPALIRRAADEALAGGADFLKTSTGKVAVNATPEAAEILLAGDPRQRPAGRAEAGGGRAHHGRRRGLPRALRPDHGAGLGAAVAGSASAPRACSTALLAALDGAEAPLEGRGY